MAANPARYNQKFYRFLQLVSGVTGTDTHASQSHMTHASPPRPPCRHASTAVTLLMITPVAGALALGWHYGWPWAVAGFLTIGAVLTFGTLYPHSRLFGSAIRRIPGTERSVILTIDDGPCDDTEALLDLLASRRVRAVFFLIGERALQRPQDVRRIVAAGHLIGNHTHTHPAYRYWCYPPWLQRRELGQCQQALASITGRVPSLFRAPVGMRNPFCNLSAAAFSLAVIGWQSRGFDGVKKPVADIISLIRSGLCPGAIVLLHQGMPHSPEVLREVLDMLARDHWTTTLPEAWLNASPPAGTPRANC
jgi:peptidoglycan/xylan/chitin deacetylase (PgdA/CDA1 family)